MAHMHSKSEFIPDNGVTRAAALIGAVVAIPVIAFLMVAVAAPQATGVADIIGHIYRQH